MDAQPDTGMRCPTCGRGMQIARYRCDACDLNLDGRFDVPPLAQLDLAEQAFVMAFVRVHGNIRKMEQLLGISYPTVKNRLRAIAAKLDRTLEAPDEAGAVLDRLARGEISVQDALSRLDRR